MIAESFEDMFETKDTISDIGLPQWGALHQQTFVGKNEEKNDQLCSYIVNQESSEDDNVEAENPLKVKPLIVPELKRKSVIRSRPCVMKAALGVKMEANIISKNRKKSEAPNRWSAERYMLAEKSMLEILKAEGATCHAPISRPELRKAARTRIGDTGLLDHLLKHIDGKVAPGGTERFKRWFNTHGIMEYWLENAELDSIREEAGVRDPYWIPTITPTPDGDASGSIGSLGELEFLKSEIGKMKSDILCVMSKKQKDETKIMGGIHEEMLNWKSNVEHQMTKILTSLNGLHVRCPSWIIGDELLRWKTEVDQKLIEITNSLEGLLAQKDLIALDPPLEEWEDWFESSNLDNIQGDGLCPLFPLEQDAMAQDSKSATQSQFNNGDNISQGPICAKELEQLKEEVANLKRSMLELVPKQEEYQANVIPDSSTTVSSKSDFDNSVVLLQEMLMELFKWKDKTEQHLVEVSNTISWLLELK